VPERAGTKRYTFQRVKRRWCPEGREGALLIKTDASNCSERTGCREAAYRNERGRGGHKIVVGNDPRKSSERGKKMQ